MKPRFQFIVLMLGLILGLELVPPVLAQSNEYEPPHDKPGPASDRIRFQSFHVDLAGESLKADEMDMYEFSLKTEAARDLKGTPGIKVYEAPATSISLILNPAPAPEGELNPFSIREVRYAVQYAVDREFIAQEIYKGLAEPMVAQVGPFDYDYLTVYDELKQETISYDPDLAGELMSEAMTGAGAELVDGKWNYNGKPIRLKFMIRVEDERREVGDLIRAQLEDLGFTVVPNYQSFAPAILTVYGSDPQLFQWHLYTEGWGRGAAEKYDFGTINSMAAPWLGNMPGWQETGFWQYENDKLDELGKRLFQGDFQTEEERNRIYRQMTDLALDESVRIWLATIVNSLPAKDDLRGVTRDISAGPKSIWTLREAYVPGKGTLTVGNLWVWTERTTWNPVGGFGDVYSNDIWQNVHDPPLWRDPFTGVPIPFRATYDVTTAGPDAKLDVPADAFMWDAEKGAFVSVGDGVKGTSKVRFDYSKFFSSKWHHGRPISMADVVYTIFQGFDLAFDEDKAQIERAISVTSRPFLETIKGFRILNDEELEVYVDYWHFVESYIAEYASPSGLSMPWEILAAMDKLVFQDRRAAYSDTAAQRFNVPWINLVMDNDTRLVRRALIEMRDSGEYPTSVFTVDGETLVSTDEADARVAAALDWIEQYGMGVISNGPFKLVRYEPPAQFAEIQAFREPTYPFKPGDWYKGSPPTLEFAEIQAGPIGIDSSATIEVRLDAPEDVAVSYLLVDPATGETVTEGQALNRGAGQFAIELPAGVTSKLAPGLHHLFLVASSEVVSSLAERRVDLEVGVEGAPGDEATPTASGEPTPTPAPSTSGGFTCGGPPLYHDAGGS